MSDIETILSEIEQRAEKATPGPWTAIHGDSYDAYPHISAAGHHFIAYDATQQDPPVREERFDYPGLDADAELIAHARTDIPRLLKALRHEMETSDHLRNHTEDVQWFVRGRIELFAILEGREP